MKFTEALIVWFTVFALGTVALETPVVHADDDFMLEEVTVTAQRREENLQEVPVSVTAVTGDTLGVRGVNDLNQLTIVAPSLQIAVDNQYSIRGIGTLAVSSALDSSVAVAVDEVNLGRKWLMGSIFNDVAQIEVLQGPQGLLFGKNASAGLLNVTTTKPKLGLVEGNASVEYGVRDSTPDNGTSIISKGVLNIPVGDISALRLNVTYATQEPVAKIKNVAGNPRTDETTENYGMKAKYLLEPSDGLSIYFIGDYNEEAGVGGVFDRSYRELGMNSTNSVPVDLDGVRPGPENLEYGASGDQFRDVETGGLQAKISYELANGYELSNIAAWKFYDLEQNLDSDFTSSDGLDVNYNQTDYRQYSNELRLAIPQSERINGQVGLYFSDMEVNQSSRLGGASYMPSFVTIGFPFCVGADGTGGCPYSNESFLGSDAEFTYTNKSAAAFGQFDINLTDKFKLIAGGRYTHDEIGVDLELNQHNYFFAFGPVDAQRRERDSNDNFSGKLGVQYTIFPDVMTYATYARGYKGPGYNISPPTHTADILIDPETVDSIEVGLKSVWLQRRLVFNATLFHQKFKDYQVESFDVALQAYILQNAASMVSEGAEFNFEFLPFRNLILNGAVTLLDSTFDDFPGAQCHPNQANCGADGTFNAAGLETPTSAKFTSTLQATYDFIIANGVHGYLTADYYHRSPTNYLISRPKQTEYGNVDLFGVSIGAEIGSDWMVTLYCKNITDEHVPTGMALEPGDSTMSIISTMQSWGFNSVRNMGLIVAFKF